MIEEFLFWAAMVGIWGYYFCAVLTNADEVFGWWPAVVRFSTNGNKAIVPAKNLLIAAIWKVLFECPKCHAGWVSFPVFLFVFSGMGAHYLLAFIVLSSFIAHVFEMIFN